MWVWVWCDVFSPVNHDWSAAVCVLVACPGGSRGAINSLAPHPDGLPLLAVSGLDDDAKLLAPDQPFKVPSQRRDTHAEWRCSDVLPYPCGFGPIAVNVHAANALFLMWAVSVVCVAVGRRRTRRIGTGTWLH